MSYVILKEVEFTMSAMYRDDTLAQFRNDITEATQSREIIWAVNSGCKVMQHRTVDDYTGNGKVIFYAALTPIQQTEFALRF